MKRQTRRAVIGSACVATLFLSGCSGTTAGAPVPEEDPSTSVASTSANEPGRASIHDIAPCSLLDMSTLDRFHEFREGVPKLTIDDEPYCTWAGIREEASGGNVPTVMVVIYPDSGIGEMPDKGGGLREGETKNGRRVVQTMTESGCTVGLAVGDGSRVEVAAGFLGEESSCDLADELVEIIDPKLPEG
ncbi:DUF3558 family protein [Saccharomonospora iraqiensis]|uniref:DUF3558 family protein n=1 Tax=Saccharomonospora iraqiensis TaxID=52698 RepID=UPI000A00FBD2|nr:DUF3558 family protein [Saccharomonospora iraqiensis]